MLISGCKLAWTVTGTIVFPRMAVACILISIIRLRINERATIPAIRVTIPFDLFFLTAIQLDSALRPINNLMDPFLPDLIPVSIFE